MKSIKILVFIYYALLLSSCEKQSADNPSSAVITDGTGVGGSTARFAIIGNTLYTVDDKSLNVFDISDAKKPIKIGRSYIGRNIETIFPRDAKTIFIGSQNGMYVYNISDPNLITEQTIVNHFRSCNLVHPKGLGLIGNNLFVCDNMLRWYDATDPRNIVSKKNFLISAHDVIALSNRLILVGDDGISQLGFGSDSV